MTGIVDILEAAFEGDHERALLLAEEAGVSRFDLSQLRRHVPEFDVADMAFGQEPAA